MNTMLMISAVKIAKYLIYEIVQKMKREGMDMEEFDVTLSRLQKLLYYCNGYSLAYTGGKIFEDTIEVKNNLPFIESVYQEYKEYDGNVVPFDDVEDIDFEDVDEARRLIIRRVICDKIYWSDYALTYQIERDRPWPDCLIARK